MLRSNDGGKSHEIEVSTVGREEREEREGGEGGRRGREGGGRTIKYEPI